MTTLAEAIEFGRGIERPFNCERHADNVASASVNVLKGVWVCYACREAGNVEGNKAPSAQALAQMLEPDHAPRFYPDAYLELFNPPQYWLTRFEPWVCRAARLGHDPLTGDATFPVYANRRCAGIVRRRQEGEPKYKYPYRWSAANSLGGLIAHPSYIVLVEGYADMVALFEAGIPAACVWGAGLHYPQRELLNRMNLDVVVLGYDADEAGRRAAERDQEVLEERYTVLDAYWRDADDQAKDPGDLSIADRQLLVARALDAPVGGILYDISEYQEAHRRAALEEAHG